MDVLKKWQVWCETENQFVEVWKHTRPEICPNDLRHEIDHSRTVFTDIKYVESERIQHVYINSKSFLNTNGYYMVEGRKFMIPSEHDVHYEDHTFALSSCVYGLKAQANPENVGDSFSLVINPDTIIGVLTNAAQAGDTLIHVSPTVTQNLVPGFYVKIGEDERRVMSIDKENGTLTLDSALSPSSTLEAAITPIKLRLYIAYHYEIGAAGTIDIGYGGMGGKTLPPGTVVRLEYNNRNKQAKALCINYEYAY